MCTRLIVTRQARLGMNGPEVIEQEAGIEEFDAADRELVWSVTGGEQRYAVGLADDLLDDDADAIAAAIRNAFREGPAPGRSTQIERYVDLLRSIDPNQPPDGKSLRTLWGRAPKP
jgi:malonate decarboxylase beta subunit